MDILWLVCTLNNVNFAIQVAWCVLVSGNVRGKGIYMNKEIHI